MSTNAARQNYLQIREQQQLNRERAREAMIEKQRADEIIQRQKAQFNHVSSHGYGNLRGGGDDVEIKVFIRECDGDRAQSFSFMENDATQKRCAAEPAAKPRPAQQLQQQRAPRGPTNAVNAPRGPTNATNAPRGLTNATNAPRGLTNAGSVPRGAVPKYIVQRKAELAAEKDALQREVERQKEVAKYPPGHRPITEEERQETLAKLASRRRELEVELNKIPIRYDTQSIRARRGKIENELSEIDEAERKFSSTRQLFVPI
ncbi:flagellar/basal body protein [Trypanosoma grayi]|uniref:flagellar/basal body protein n=1 Tax=Trypanosoma grayi TaxID=71804 RepID=UPI0004F46191|nr:flagellar/basal body protein [Trypanosoma grayi]KEG10679.1 flagellar/basal body protein [Trypanosoma grayi]